MGKMMSPFFSAVLDRILFVFAGNDNIHESLNEFDIRPDPITGFTVVVIPGKLSGERLQDHWSSGFVFSNEILQTVRSDIQVYILNFSEESNDLC